MYIISETHCTQCKMLKQMLGENALRVQFINASQNMELCKELRIKTIPALVKRNADGEHEIVFGLEKIVSEVEKVK